MHLNNVFELVPESTIEELQIIRKFPEALKIKIGTTTRYYVREELRGKVFELIRELTAIEINEADKTPQLENKIEGEIIE